MSLNHQKQSYRELLLEQFVARCSRNPRYSERAFAKDLGLQPGRLNEVLRGKKGLSKVSASAIALRLNFTEQERSFFCDLVESEHARNKSNRRLAQLRLKKYQQIGEYRQVETDVFNLISQWYHLAILEALTIPGLSPDVKTLARSLGISISDVELAAIRLERLRFLKRKGDRLIVLNDKSSTPGKISSDSVNRFHEQVFHKASRALFLQHRDQTEFNTTFVAIDSSKMAEAKEMIGTFWREFCEKMNQSGTRDSVYALSIQFFDLFERHHESKH